MSLIFGTVLLFCNGSMSVKRFYVSERKRVLPSQKLRRFAQLEVPNIVHFPNMDKTIFHVY